ncbi:hypothetical protein [Klebsiella pneumoniae]|uniref:hypothetical protein n=1 Tax=Klebsiella pneumoniae TaxID=573 RepID=UPI00388E3FAB
MAHQTPFTSFNKRPRSIRLVLAELFSGRVSARLAELEERVFELEKRIDAQATAIANLGATVGMGKVRDSVASRVLRESQAHKDSSHGKFQRNRLKPMAYGVILATLAAVAVPAGQSLLIPDTTTSTTTLQTTPLPERPPVSLDGMLLDTILARPATPDLPSAVTEAIA